MQHLAIDLGSRPASCLRATASKGFERALTGFAFHSTMLSNDGMNATSHSLDPLRIDALTCAHHGRA